MADRRGREVSHRTFTWCGPSADKQAVRIGRPASAWAGGAIGGTALILCVWAFWLEPASLTVAEHRLSLGGAFVPPDEIAAELQRLRAPAGVFAALGNHDNRLDHGRVQAALERTGVQKCTARLTPLRAY
jgi:hypothetical protein